MIIPAIAKNVKETLPSAQSLGYNKMILLLFFVNWLL